MSAKHLKNPHALSTPNAAIPSHSHPRHSHLSRRHRPRPSIPITLRHPLLRSNNIQPRNKAQQLQVLNLRDIDGDGIGRAAQAAGMREQGAFAVDDEVETLGLAY